MFSIGIFGMFIHFLKRKVKGESLLAIWQFFTNNLKTSIIALVFTSVGTAAYYTQVGTGEVVDLLMVFSIGFNVDSLINKWDKKGTPV